MPDNLIDAQVNIIQVNCSVSHMLYGKIVQELRAPAEDSSCKSSSYSLSLLVRSYERVQSATKSIIEQRGSGRCGREGKNHY